MLLNDKMIFAIDYDGTLEKDGVMNDRLISFFKTAKESGNILILNTCRHDHEGKYSLDAAVDKCKEKGLIFDYINENVPELVEKYGDCRKIAADIYIEDNVFAANDLEAFLKKIDAINEHQHKLHEKEHADAVNERRKLHKGEHND